MIVHDEDEYYLLGNDNSGIFVIKCHETNIKN